MPASTEETQAAVLSRAAGVEDTAATSATRAPDPGAALRRGGSVGRYVVVSRLGAGAMGVVYVAYDPELDRKVALKVLASQLGGDAGSEGQARLLREAQALAQLSHPNVVTVHDVGAVGGRVWIAMEFVRGRTLGQWLDAERRGWREVVEVMIAAGRGLRAAHEADLLHRDFKPDNVMVGDDGRVRVMDFGLARAHRGEGDSIGSETRAETQRSTLDQEVTRAGALMGTPAYMSPEQLEGGSATPQSDQFSYCVTLWEGLFAERPFRGDSLMELMAAVLAGERRPMPKGRQVPGWLRRVCLRGTSLDPGDRFASIDELLSALVRGEAIERRRRRLAVAAGLGALLAGYWGWQRLDEHRATKECMALGNRVDEIWNDGVRDEVREGLLATGVSYGETTASRVEPYLSAHAHALRSAWTDACLDTRVRGEWTEDLLTRSTWCLDERALELEALVAELADADETIARHAVSAAAGLADVADCLDELGLRRRPLPPEDDEQVEATRKLLSKARALRHAGKFDEGLEVARRALAAAQELDWPPLTASAHRWTGDLLFRSGEAEAGEATLHEAYFEAVGAGATDEAIISATHLAFVVGYGRGRPAEALLWVRHAEAALDALGEPDSTLRRAELLNIEGLAHLETDSDFEEAEAALERSIALFEAQLGPDHPLVANPLQNLATVQTRMGRFEDAIATHERALALRERALGADHPQVAHSLEGLAVAHARLEQLDEAEALFRRVLELRKHALGDDHPDVAQALSNLSNIHSSRGDYEQQLALLRQALSIAERSLRPDHPSIGRILNNMALSLYYTGKNEEAIELFERTIEIHRSNDLTESANFGMVLNNLGLALMASKDYDAARQRFVESLEVRERVLGPTHPDLGQSLSNLGDACVRAEDDLAAREHFERSLSIYEAGFGPNHPNLGYPLTGLAHLELRAKRFREAIAHAERAVRVRSDGETLAASLAKSEYALACALWDAPPGEGRDRPRAHALALRARDRSDASMIRGVVEAWLQEHPPPS